jgi:hypothetical protein
MYIDQKQHASFFLFLIENPLFLKNADPLFSQTVGGMPDLNREREIKVIVLIIGTVDYLIVSKVSARTRSIRVNIM